jgi:hypothetical protein
VERRRNQDEQSDHKGVSLHHNLPFRLVLLRSDLLGLGLRGETVRSTALEASI